MDLIITYYDSYYNFHGTLNLNYACQLSLKSNSRVICFYDKISQSKIIDNYKLLNQIDFISLNKITNNIYTIIYDEYSKEVEKLCHSLVLKYKPKKLLFFNEFYFFKYFLKINIYKIYFVRSLSKPLIKSLKKYPIPSFQYNTSISMEKRRARAEKLVIDKADLYITDSFFSKKMLKDHYKKESLCIPGLIDTTQFSIVKSPNFNILSAYYLGRTDWQKGLQRVKKPAIFSLYIIGDQILTEGGLFSLSNAKLLGWMIPNEYIPIIESIPFAIFPHLWESNGLTVQEAMTMGKIVVVQKGSGGCEEHVKDGYNGFSFDFGNNEDWEIFLRKISLDFDLKNISYNARNSIKKDGYEKSIENLAKTICA